MEDQRKLSQNYHQILQDTILYSLFREVPFLQCENLNDSEHMTWVLINHVKDLIELAHENPVQDFIGAIHRNSSASSLFIQAIHARWEDVKRVSI